MKKLLKALRMPVMVTLVLLVLCGLVYPTVMTGISQLVFPAQADGNLIYVDGEAVGATFVGQDFTDPRFLKCRPSAVNYNTYTDEQAASGEYGGVASGSNNYGPSNPDLVARVQADIDAFLEHNPDVRVEDLPADLMTASGSGLDPHISPAAAEVQIPQLAINSGLPEAQLREMVSANTDGKVFGVLGEEVVNVLGVNLAIAQALGLIGEVE